MKIRIYSCVQCSFLDLLSLGKLKAMQNCKHIEGGSTWKREELYKKNLNRIAKELEP